MCQLLLHDQISIKDGGIKMRKVQDEKMNKHDIEVYQQGWEEGSQAEQKIQWKREEIIRKEERADVLKIIDVELNEHTEEQRPKDGCDVCLMLEELKSRINSPQAGDSTPSRSGATEDVRGATPQTAVSKPVDNAQKGCHKCFDIKRKGGTMVVLCGHKYDDGTSYLCPSCEAKEKK